MMCKRLIFLICFVAALGLASRASATLVTDGLILHLDASVGVEEAAGDPAEDGGKVMTWLDQSASGYDATQVPYVDRRPIYKTDIIGGKPVLRFSNLDVTSFDLAGMTSEGTDHTFLFVYSANLDQGPFNFLFDTSTSGVGRFAIEAVGGVLEVGYYDGSHQYAADQVTGPQIGTWLFEGEGAELFRDGVSLGTGTWSQIPIGGQVRLGADKGGGKARFDGDMAEVLVYNRALSTSERNQVGSYLGTKYGIAYIPEPTTIVLLGLGGLAVLRRRKS